MFMYFVYAYSMRDRERLDIWSILISHRIVSYHEDVREACWTASDHNNYDTTNPDECFEVHSIPLCHNEHNLV